MTKSFTLMSQNKYVKFIIKNKFKFNSLGVFNVMSHNPIKIQDNETNIKEYKYLINNKRKIEASQPLPIKEL